MPAMLELPPAAPGPNASYGPPAPTTTWYVFIGSTLDSTPMPPRIAPMLPSFVRVPSGNMPSTWPWTTKWTQGRGGTLSC